MTVVNRWLLFAGGHSPSFRNVSDLDVIPRLLGLRTIKEPTTTYHLRLDQHSSLDYELELPATAMCPRFQTVRCFVREFLPCRALFQKAL